MIDLTVCMEKLEKKIAAGELAVSDPDRRCNCGQCDGYGHVYTANEMRECKASKERRIAELLYPRYEDWPVPSFTEIRQAKGFVETPTFISAEQMAQDVRDHNNPYGRIWCGGHGRGKTRGALGVLRICAWKGIQFCECKFPELVSQYKRGIDGGPWIDSLYSRMGSIKTDLVFVDEFGREAMVGNQDHARIAITEIVSRCYRKKFLIITSNMTPKELGLSLPTDVLSRLNKKAGYCETIEEPCDIDLRQQSLL